MPLCNNSKKDIQDVTTSRDYVTWLRHVICIEYKSALDSANVRPPNMYHMVILICYFVTHVRSAYLFININSTKSLFVEYICKNTHCWALGHHTHNQIINFYCLTHRPNSCHFHFVTNHWLLIVLTASELTTFNWIWQGWKKYFIFWDRRRTWKFIPAIPTRLVVTAILFFTWMLYWFFKTCLQWLSLF